MADGHHIENCLLAIYPRFIVRLTRNLVYRSRITLGRRPRDQNSNFRNFKMTDVIHFQNGFIAISAESHPISTKFGTHTEILVPRTVT